jgi:hypothetical protein
MYHHFDLQCKNIKGEYSLGTNNKYETGKERFPFLTAIIRNERLHCTIYIKNNINESLLSSTL